MLGKLIKHEFKATGKTFGLLYIALILLTILTRFCVYIPFHNTLFVLVKAILHILYFIVVFCMSLFSIVIVLKRFYSNMLKDQGYLSNTLPVKMWQQILAKVITYTVWIIASIAMMFVSFIVYIVGSDDFNNLLRSTLKLLENIGNYPKVIPMLLFTVVLVLAQIVVNMLSFFAAVSLGQIFNKHRVAGSIAFYFLLNYVMGIVTSAAMMIIPDFTKKMDSIDVRINAADTVGEAITAIQGPVYICLTYVLIIEIILGAIYFGITNYMLSKKLNLE